MLEVEGSFPGGTQAAGGPMNYDKTLASLKKKFALIEDQVLAEKQKQIQDLEKSVSAITAALPALKPTC